MCTNEDWLFEKDQDLTQLVSIPSVAKLQFCIPFGGVYGVNMHTYIHRALVHLNAIDMLKQMELYWNAKTASIYFEKKKKNREMRQKI